MNSELSSEYLIASIILIWDRNTYNFVHVPRFNADNELIKTLHADEPYTLKVKVQGIWADEYVELTSLLAAPTALGLLMFANSVSFGTSVNVMSPVSVSLYPVQSGQAR